MSIIHNDQFREHGKEPSSIGPTCLPSTVAHLSHAQFQEKRSDGAYEEYTRPLGFSRKRWEVRLLSHLRYEYFFMLVCKFVNIVVCLRNRMPNLAVAGTRTCKIS